MIFAAIAFAAFSPLTLQADSNSLLEQGYFEMYNLEFVTAHQRFREWEKRHPEDAMGPVSDAAAYLFSEFDRLQILQSQFFVDNSAYLSQKKANPDPAVQAKFQQDLDRALRLADAMLAKSPKDKDALLAKVLRLGLESDYKGLIEKQNLAALSQIKLSTALAQQLLQEHPDCYDANIAAGIQNYLLSLKPAPVRWLLRMTGAQTDKQEGLKNIRIVAEKGHYLKPYAKLLLAIAALRDGDKKRARELLCELAMHFPKNHLYQEELKKIS